MGGTLAQADYSGSDLQSILGETPFYYGQYGECSGQGTGDVTLTGGDNEQEAYNFFIQNGLSAVQASAVVGNLMDESGVNPTAIQSGGESNDPNASGSAGWGIAQWTPGSNVIQIAQGLNITAPIYDLGTQLTIVWNEMTGTSPPGDMDMAKTLEQMTDLDQATQFFEADFEEGAIAYATPIPNDPGSNGYLAARETDATQVFQQYGSSSSGNSGSTTTTSVTSYCNTTAVNCSSNTGGSGDSGDTDSTGVGQLRQNVVCAAQQQLALWSSQPGYNTTNFPYAANGYLTYSQGTYEEWCADFISWVYDQAGYPLQPDPNWLVAGVPEAVTIAQQNTNFTWHPAGSSYTPQPGDLAVHYIPQSGDSSPPQQIASDYNHINIFISSSGGVSTYIGGDQGNGPWGAASPTNIPPNPPSESVVSTQTLDGYWGNSADTIMGYISPN